MAWLIALALVWWIGSSITKGIDKVNYDNAQRCLNLKHSYENFLNQLYIAAWPRYQDMEQQAIQKWEELEYPDDPFYSQNWPFFRRLQTEMFGDYIEKIAIREACCELQKNGIQTYCVNPNFSQRDRFGYELIPCYDKSGPNIDVLFYWIDTRPYRSDYLYWRYRYAILQKTAHQSLISFVPPIDDARVYYYFYRGVFHERTGSIQTTQERKMLFHEYRLKKDNSLNEFFAHIYVLAWWFYHNADPQLPRTDESLAFLFAGDRLCEFALPVYIWIHDEWFRADGCWNVCKTDYVHHTAFKYAAKTGWPSSEYNWEFADTVKDPRIREYIPSRNALPQDQNQKQ